MAFTNRVIWRSGSSLIDLSQQMNNYLSGTSVLDLKASSDALYLGSDLPFNHRWFNIDVPNQNASRIQSIQIWNGSTWMNTVDLMDDTVLMGATFAKSGYVAFVPDRLASAWSRQYTTETMADLSTLKIYNLYWIKITFSADLSALTELSYIGHRFANDVELRLEYPELFNPDLMTALGVANWNQQHAVTAEYVIRDLMRDQAIYSSNQLLDWEIFKSAGVHRAAAMIYYSLGPAYNEHYNRAIAAYKQSLDLKFLRIDQSGDATLDSQDLRATTTWLSR